MMGRMVGMGCNAEPTLAEVSRRLRVAEERLEVLLQQAPQVEPHLRELREIRAMLATVAAEDRLLDHLPQASVTPAEPVERGPGTTPHRGALLRR